MPLLIKGLSEFPPVWDSFSSKKSICSNTLPFKALYLPKSNFLGKPDSVVFCQPILLPKNKTELGSSLEAKQVLKLRSMIIKRAEHVAQWRNTRLPMWGPGFNLQHCTKDVITTGRSHLSSIGHRAIRNLSTSQNRSHVGTCCRLPGSTGARPSEGLRVEKKLLLVLLSGFRRESWKDQGSERKPEQDWAKVGRG